MYLSPLLRRKEGQKFKTSKPRRRNKRTTLFTYGVPRSVPGRTSRWCVFFLASLLAWQQHLVPPSTPCRPLFCSPIPFKTRNNEDHLCPAPCLRRFGRRLCPPGLQQGATNEATSTEKKGRHAFMQIGNFRFGVDRREWPSYFAVLVARTKNHGGMLCEQEMLMGSVG